MKTLRELTLLLLPFEYLRPMRTGTLLCTVELLQEAIHRVNRRSNLHLTNRAVIVLVVVYRAEITLGGITQNQVVSRLMKTHNHYTKIASFEHLKRLTALGLLDRQREGNAFIFRCTLAGKNYIQLFERTLREVRQKF